MELVGATPGSAAHKAAWKKMWATSRGGEGKAGEAGGAFESWYASMFAAPPPPSSPGGDAAAAGNGQTADAGGDSEESWSDCDADPDGDDVLRAAQTELLKAKSILASSAGLGSAKKPTSTKRAPKRP